MKTKLFLAGILIICMIVIVGVPCNASADIRIMSANGMRDTVRELHQQLESATGQRVTVTFGEAGDLRRRLQAGEAADVVILPRPVMDQAVADGKVAAGTTIDLARTEIGVGVRTGTPALNMSSADGLKRALLAAKTIVITDPASGGVSGVHMADVFQRLGIADAIKPKLKLHTGGYNAEFVAKGEADMAFQLANEVRAVPGIDFIPLPAEFQRQFVFSTALTPNAKDSASARAAVQFLSGPAGAAGIRAKRLEPLTSR